MKRVRKLNLHIFSKQYFYILIIEQFMINITSTI